MLTNSETKEMIFNLLNLRKKLLWMISQIPINEVQRNWIEKGKEHLEKVNQMLKDFNIELPD